MFKALAPIFASPLARFFIIALAVCQLARFGFTAYFHARLDGGSQWLLVLFNGLRIDVAVIALWVAPALLMSIASVLAFGRMQRAMGVVIGLWLYVGLVALLFMEVATPTFIAEFDVRPNRLFVEYLNAPKEVGGMLMKGFSLQVTLGLIVTVAGSWLLWRFFQPVRYMLLPSALATRLSYVAVYLMLIPALIIGARSGLQHRPINPAMVAVSNDRLINSLALNSFYSVLYAAYQSRHDAGQQVQYGDMSITEAVGLLRQDINSPAQFLNQSTVHRVDADARAAGKDLLVVVLESHGAHFVESLGGNPVSPNIEAWRHKSWFFDNLYATGIRSARGLEAIVAGFPPTAAKAVLKRPKAQSQFTTLASVLKAEGFYSQFIYGGESHFDNMKGFFLGNGFDEVVDQYDYQNPMFEGSWGVSDEDLFDEVFRKLSQSSAGPRFTLAFTSSNHPPFEYPAGKITPFDSEPATALNSAKYADFALGQFLTKLELSGLLDNLVVLVIADHEDKVFGNKPVPYERFRIPGFIIAPGLDASIDTRITSQIDMAPTLLSLLGVRGEVPFIGRDLTRPSNTNGRAIMQFGDNAAYMTDQGICYLQPSQTPLYEAFNQASSMGDHCQKALAYETWANFTYDNEAYSAGAFSRYGPENIQTAAIARH